MGWLEWHTSDDESFRSSNCPKSFPLARCHSSSLCATWTPACRTARPTCGSRRRSTGAAIGIMDQARGRTFAACRPPRGLRRQVLRHVCPHRAAYQLARRNVLNSSQVQPTFISHHVCDIGYPGFVRPGWREGLVQQTLRDWACMTRICGCFELALLLAPQVQLPSQSHNAVAPRIEQLRNQFRQQPQLPVSLSCLDMRRLDRRLQPLVVLRAATAGGSPQRSSRCATRLSHGTTGKAGNRVAPTP